MKKGQRRTKFAKAAYRKEIILRDPDSFKFWGADVRNSKMGSRLIRLQGQTL